MRPAARGRKSRRECISARTAALKPGFYHRVTNRSGTAYYASVVIKTAEAYCFGGFMFKQIKEDIACVKARDPAATSIMQILFLYPGLKAVRSHRRANFFYRHGFKFIARWISQRCSRKTGIEIHPAAQIGKRFFIDHGTGVVIGETTIIGDDVLLYQGVTLGGTGKETGKRHPTLGNGVMVGTGAKVLGNVTIGDNTKIAAGAVVINDIPADSTAAGVPAKTIKTNGERIYDDLDWVHIPDPVQQEIDRLEAEIEELRKLQEKGEER